MQETNNNEGGYAKTAALVGTRRGRGRGRGRGEGRGAGQRGGGRDPSSRWRGGGGDGDDHERPEAANNPCHTKNEGRGRGGKGGRGRDGIGRGVGFDRSTTVQPEQSQVLADRTTSKKPTRACEGRDVGRNGRGYGRGGRGTGRSKSVDSHEIDNSMHPQATSPESTNDNTNDTLSTVARKRKRARKDSTMIN